MFVSRNAGCHFCFRYFHQLLAGNNQRMYRFASQKKNIIPASYRYHSMISMCIRCESFTTSIWASGMRPRYINMSIRYQYHATPVKVSRMSITLLQHHATSPHQHNPYPPALPPRWSGCLPNKGDRLGTGMHSSEALLWVILNHFLLGSIKCDHLVAVTWL